MTSPDCSFLHRGTRAARLNVPSGNCATSVDESSVASRRCGCQISLRLRNTPRHLRLMQIVILGETIMTKILVVAAFTASIAVSSFAFAQSTGGGAAGAGRAGTAGTAGMSDQTTGRDMTDPSTSSTRNAEPTPSAAERGGSGTPGSRTTGAGMAPSDRATGSKSGEN